MESEIESRSYFANSQLNPVTLISEKIKRINDILFYTVTNSITHISHKSGIEFKIVEFLSII